MKHCNKCDELKPQNTEHFNKLPSGNYRGTCKTCMAANTKKHYYENPQAVKSRVDKYKRQKDVAEGNCSKAEADKIRRTQQDLCFYCGVGLSGRGELDHKDPISRGGSNWPSNMAWACITCNRDKHNKTVAEFIKWRISLDLPFV